MSINNFNEKYYRQMLLIRVFEEKLYDLFSKGLIFGTTHGYVGQEANAVGIINNLARNDIVFSNHRCHGHYLIYSDDVVGLMAELMGKESGICGGRGGSQHLCYKNFYTNGVQGGIVPNAVGIVLAEKIKGSNSIGIVFIGDGTLGQGVLYESLNIASLWSVPIIFVVENNRYAQSTYYKNALSGDFIKRGEAFGIDTSEIETNDVDLIDNRFKEIISLVRNKKKPYMFIIHTYRLGPHSKGDDDRDKNEIEIWQKKDPIKLYEMKHSLKKGYIEDVKGSCVQKVDFAVSDASKERFPLPDII